MRAFAKFVFLLPGVLGAGCATLRPPEAPFVTTIEPAAQQRTMRAAPSQRAMTRALQRQRDAIHRCLGWGVTTVDITGEFDGPTGQFEVSDVGGALGGPVPHPVRVCIEVAAQQARVRPFRDTQAAFTLQFTFSNTASETPSSTTDSSDSIVTNPYVSPTANNPFDSALPARSTAPSSPTSNPTDASAVPSPAVRFVGPSSLSEIPSMFGSNLLISANRQTPAQVLQDRMQEFYRCFPEGGHNHSIEGSVELHFQLDANGAPRRTGSRVQTRSPNAGFWGPAVRCIEGMVREMRFATQRNPGTEYVVLIPYELPAAQTAGIPLE